MMESILWIELLSIIIQDIYGLKLKKNLGGMMMNQERDKKVLLSELICGVLLEKQYSSGAIGSYRMVWRKLQQYFDASGEMYYSQDTVMDFLRDKYGIISGESMKKTQVDALRKVQVLEDYYRSECFTLFSSLFGLDRWGHHSSALA
jgi:hypothetical protein